MLDLPSAVAPALSLLSVSKRFGATQALEDVDIAIAAGEVVALMGSNGAGKSTLAKIAAGVVRPDSGCIVVSGRELRLASPQAARAAGIVVVHQSTDQLGVPGLTVAENLTLDSLRGRGAGGLSPGAVPPGKRDGSPTESDLTRRSIRTSARSVRRIANSSPLPGLSPPRLQS